MKMITLYVSALALAAPGAASAASEMVSLANAVYVEKIEGSEAGQPKKVLAPPRSIGRGDTLIFVVSYRNRGADPASDVVVTNAVPATVAYAGAEQPSAIVSVDGGRSWGPLASLTVHTAEGGFRAATTADVTHVRWTFPRAIGAGETGELRFRGIVK